MPATATTAPALDPFCEDLELVSALVAALPVTPTAATTSRWQSHGIRGIRLKSIRIGGRPFTTRDAFREFIAAIQPEGRR